MEKHPSLPPETDTESINKLEFEFYQQYGQTLATWARLEQAISEVFCEICGTAIGNLGTALFFSGKSFGTRAALLGAANRNAGLKDSVQEVIRALIKKARQFESARNIIAHGYPIHMIWADVEWQGWRIKEGDEAHQPGGIGLSELKNAADNFARLELYTQRVRTLVSASRASAEMFVEGYLEPIRGLPIDALLPPEAPNDKAHPLLDQ